MPNLKKLIISFNKLDEFNTNIFDETPLLEEIDLHYNQINHIEINELSSLVKIDLSKNCLKEINADSFQNLPKLKEINLTHNLIMLFSIGSFCRNLPQIEFCDLRSNQKLKRVDLLAISLIGKKFYFDQHVKLDEYSRIPVEILIKVKRDPRFGWCM